LYFSIYLTIEILLQVDNFGTVNLVEACRKAGVTRFVLVSSILVNGAAMGQILNPAYIVLNLLGLTLAAKLQAEKHIRRYGINYTIVRPGGLTDQPPTGSIIMEPEVKPKISFLMHYEQ
jgi:nucleoside-diphosphate-sugar epimerase